MSQRVPPWWFFVLLLAAGEREQARALWCRYVPDLWTASRNPLPELLKGHLFGAHRGEGI